MNRLAVPAAWLMLAAAMAIGCGRTREPIVSYEVPHLPATHRMLGAVAAGPDQTWFFKLTGTLEQAEAEAEGFRELIDSLQWPEEGRPPTWKLPEGWQELPGGRSRFATLTTNTPGVEVSVTLLRNNPSMSADDYALLNFNRWRKQLKLTTLDLQQMQEQSQTIDAAGRPVLLVDFEGRLPAPPPESEQTASTRPVPPALGGTGRELAAPREEEDSPVGFERPESWRPAPPAAFSVVSLEAGEGAQRARVTVSSAGGDLASNVNRWRGQVGLPPLPDEQVGSSGEELKIDGRDGQYFELIGERAAILGIIVPEGDRSWFVKLTGPASTARAEKERFLEFAGSLKFPAKD